MGTNRIQIGNWTIEMSDEWQNYGGGSSPVDPRWERDREMRHNAKGPYFRVSVQGQASGSYAQLNEVPMELLLAFADFIYRKAQQSPVFVNRPIIELAIEPPPKPQQPASEDDYTGEPNPSEVRRLRNKMEDT